MAIFDALKTSRIELNVPSLENATYAIEGSDLIITVPGEAEAIVINNFAVAVESGAPLELVTTDGVVSELEELQAAIDASSIGEVAPAAGPQGGTGGTGGGAGFAPNQNEGIGEGLGIDGLLAGTALEFGGEGEEEVIQPLLAEATPVETDPCNALFEEKVAAFRSSFRGDPEFDDPNGFKYYYDNVVVSGDGNDPNHVSNQPSASYEHGIDINATGSLSQANDLMNSTNVNEETRVIVGDEFVDEDSDDYNGNLELSAEFIGNNQVVSVYNDKIQGTANTTAIFGDALIDSDPYDQDRFDVESKFDISGTGESTSNNNTVTSNSDEIIAGVQTRVISGDIGRVTDDREFLNDRNNDATIGISVTHSFSDDDGSTEARNNVFSANEDLIDASAVEPGYIYRGLGNVISGDALSGGTHLVEDDMYGRQIIGGSTGPLNITLSSEFTVSFTGEAVYSDNEMRSMNDLIIGSDGMDVIAGDALLDADYMYGGQSNDMSDTRVNMDFYVDLAATGTITFEYLDEDEVVIPINGGTIENNQFISNNDVIDGGAGTDFIAGDVLLTANDSYYYFGGTGEPSIVDMYFNVSLDAAGQDSLEGGEGNDTLYSADGGTISGNLFSAYNDIIRGDDGTVQDGMYGDFMYGSSDFLVGDVMVADPNGSLVQFEADYSISSSSDDDETPGVVENNTVEAWNDTLIGGAGNDIMVGDVFFMSGHEEYTYNYLDLQVFGSVDDDVTETEKEMSLFNDLLCGGDGNDVLIGDFFGYYQYGNGERGNFDLIYYTDEYEGTQEYFGESGFVDADGLLRADMFNDTLRGDAGDDMLYGQLGDDLLVGGEGADTFVYEGNDGWEYTVEYTGDADDTDGVLIEVFNDNEARTDGHDTIQDFNHILEGDFINLDELFDNLGILASVDRAAQVNITDNVVTVEGIDNFSITVQGDDLDEVSAADNYSYQELFDIGIDVGGLEFPSDVS